MGKTKFNIEQVKEILSVKNPNVEILEDVYVNNSTKMKCLCKIHNYELSTAWAQLQEGHGCPICGKSMPLTMDIVKDRLSKINGDIEILDKEYVNLHHKMKCRCKIDDYEWMVHAGNLLHNNRGCPRCAGNERFTSERAYEILIEKCKNISFDKFEYRNNKTNINCTCDICGHEWSPTFASLSKGVGCPTCAGKNVLVGFNDISTVRPDLVKYFKNKDDAKSYVVGSNSYVDMICPECNSERKFRIAELSNKKFTCNSCSDGITLPNKMLYNVLSQSGLNFEIEKSINNSRIRYDGVLTDKNIVIECHGKQHYENWTKGKSLEHEIKNDKMKRELAKSLGFTYIEVDCRKSDMDFIRDNLVKELRHVIDFKDYNWGSIYKNSMSSLVVECAKLKSENPELTTTEIGKVLSLSKGTVRNYLITATKLKLCIYDGKEEALRIIESNKGKGGVKGKPVLKLNLNREVLSEYNTIKDVISSNDKYTSTMYKIVRLEKEFDGFLWMYKKEE